VVPGIDFFSKTDVFTGNRKDAGYFYGINLFSIKLIIKAIFFFCQ
jgi:hypothetical protein